MAADVTTTGGDGNGRPGLRVQPRYPGTEARAGKFPGPSLIPALTAIQRRVGWLPSEELVALSRDVRRPLYEIEGLISFYPHFRTSPPKSVQLAVCHDLTCWLHGADDRIREAKERYGGDVEIEIVEVSCLGRCDDAPAAAVDERPLPIGEAVAAVEAARGGNRGETAARTREGERRPNDPYETAGEHYGVFRGRSRESCAPRRSSRRSRTRRCAEWAGRGSRPGRSGRSSRARSPSRTTRSATPTSPNPERSRTARSSPSSRTSSWRG